MQNPGGPVNIGQRKALADRNPQSQSSEEKAWNAAVANRSRVWGVNLALLFVFLRFTGLHEFIALKLGVNTYLLYLVAPFAIIFFLATGGIGRTWAWRPARFWIGFVVWLILATPFSFWKGGSARVVFSYMRTECIVLFLIAGLVMTLGEVWRLMATISAAAAVVVVIGRLLSKSMDPLQGRLELVGGSMADPNDFAALSSLLLPFLILVIVTSNRNLLLRILAFGAALSSLYLILGTGSRGSFIGLIVASMYALWRLPIKYKVLAGTLLPLMAIGLAIALPPQVRERFTTILGRHNVQESETAAEASSEARMYLLKTSLKFTIQHPLFGVGPGQFTEVEGLTARENGQRGSWHETHNTYTQVSSEDGIPALIFFMAALITTYRMLNRVYRKSRAMPQTEQNRRIAVTAFCAMLSLVAFCSSIFFLSLAYRFYLPALTGIAIALTRAAEHEWSVAAAGNRTGAATGLESVPVSTTPLLRRPMEQRRRRAALFGPPLS